VLHIRHSAYEPSLSRTRIPKRLKNLVSTYPVASYSLKSIVKEYVSSLFAFWVGLHWRIELTFSLPPTAVKGVCWLVPVQCRKRVSYG